MKQCEHCKVVVSDLGKHLRRGRCDWIQDIRDSRKTLDWLSRHVKQQRAYKLKGEYKGKGLVKAKDTAGLKGIGI